MTADPLRKECEELARKLKVGRTVKSPHDRGGLYADVPWDEGLAELEAFAKRMRREGRQEAFKETLAKWSDNEADDFQDWLRARADEVSR